MVVETMKKEHLSIYAAMQEFGINDHKIIERWERIYLEEGPEGLSVERRGRSSTGRSKKLPKEVEVAKLISFTSNVCTVPCPSTVLANKNALKHKKIIS